MKKIISSCLLLILLLTSLLTFTSCSSQDVEFLYHIDNYVFEVVANKESLPEIYVSEIEKHEFLSFYEQDGRVHILTDITYYHPDNPSEFLAEAQSAFKKLFPSYANVIEGIELEITKDYFGTSLAGTEYYHFKIMSDENISIPVRFINNSSFMLGSEKASWNEQESRYSLLTTVTANEDTTIYELEYKVLNVTSGALEIDVSTPSPGIKYTFYHSHADTTALTYELQAIGMNVEYVDSQQVVFYESYDTTNDFNNVFPVRTYSMFGIVSMVDYKHGSFFTSDGKFTLTIYEVPTNLNVDVQIVSQDNTNFSFTHNEQKEVDTNNTFRFHLIDNTVITAEYSNVRWFESVTSMLVIIAIILAGGAMIFLARRR